MAWIKSTYEFGSLFSYRIPNFSSQYAMASLFPGPSTIKLGLVSTAIETFKNVKYGEMIFEKIKTADIKIGLPQKLVVTHVLVKRLKKQKNQRGLETTFGIRGYVHYLGKLSIYFKIDDENFKEITTLFKKMRTFGTTDSFVWCTEISSEKPSLNSVCFTTTIPAAFKKTENFIIIPAKDIHPEATFEDVNTFLQTKTHKKKKNVLIDVFCVFKFKHLKNGKNWTEYSF